MCKYLVDVVVLSGPMGSKTPTYRGILLSLASISRTISAYALDALWETLDDIVPLIHLLPRDSFKYDEYHGQTVSEALHCGPLNSLTLGVRIFFGP